MTTMPTTDLDVRRWGQRLAALAVAACDPEPGQDSELLREGYALLALAPRRHAGSMPRLPRRETFEALIAAGAAESAALALLPENAGWIVSRGANGVHLASVMLDGDDDEVAAEAPNAGLALLAALAGALRHALPQSDSARDSARDFDGFALAVPPAHLLH